MNIRETFDDLRNSVKAGRVNHTGFLEPDLAAELVAKLRQADISVTVSGGYPGAKRRVVTVFPDTIPEATTPLSAIYIAEAPDEATLNAGLRRQLEPGDIGDIIRHQDGYSAVILAKESSKLKTSINVAGHERSYEPFKLGLLAGSRKRVQVIVPSLRVDALGAKAFNVSRSYFAKGIAAGNVTINGKRADKSSSSEVGDEIYAQGIGRMYLNSVQGETRKGNLKVLLDVEKA
ncbi:MAG: hypothetical protein KC422_01100 [Trueperaceae bacterium]|nr:hypothetical protein [Trueperaceae bacterium]